MHDDTALTFRAASLKPNDDLQTNAHSDLRDRACREVGCYMQ